jgi:type I restriction enzyme S subunit
LIIEGNGSAEQIGRAALFRGEVDPCVHQNHVIRIRPDQRLIDPEYLNEYLNSPAGQDEVQSRSRTTSGLRGLSVGRIKAIEIPLPSVEVQRAVVRRLQEIKVGLGGLAQSQDETATHLDALPPSILDKAFKREL